MATFTTVAAAAPAGAGARATATAEFNGVSAATQSHHHHNTVHRVHLLQKEANPCNIRKPLGLEPKQTQASIAQGSKFTLGKIEKMDNASQQ
jgi:hypothetical protein